jgi:hypothetical protein
MLSKAVTPAVPCLWTIDRTTAYLSYAWATAAFQPAGHEGEALRAPRRYTTRFWRMHSAYHFADCFGMRCWVS